MEWRKNSIDSELKAFLDEKVTQYNTPNFIENDPISIPHRYSLKEDIEIAGFLAASISWGNRKVIVQNGHRMLDLLGESPFDYVMSANTTDLKRLENFVHRTFNGEDFSFFIKGLKNIYSNHNGIESIFYKNSTTDSLQPAISEFKKKFFEISHPERTCKHISDPERGSAAKRINMMLRWFVRYDKNGVDLGIWKTLKPSQLSCPLDIHSGNIARKFGLLYRKQNDAMALKELDYALRILDINDPVKYDFALFGLGIFEKF
ncbi:MAG: TIGR02757 family protein [Bacteroidetes bacterium]|nr:TIGR02757 family protein [Bacteroidota bacterium]